MARKGFVDQQRQERGEAERRVGSLPQEIAERTWARVDLVEPGLAGSAVAIRRANGRVVTVAVTAMSFHRPVFVGDEVSCYAKILKVGRTSLTVQVEAFARRDRSGEAIKVTEGVFTYVAVNAESKPRPV